MTMPILQAGYGIKKYIKFQKFFSNQDRIYKYCMTKNIMMPLLLTNTL